MHRLPSVALPHGTARSLADLQAEVDKFPNYTDRVTFAKQRFAARNKPSDPVFGVVREHLIQTCCGPRRCGYCEDSVADEVEHIQPKDLYPEAAFVWENYLYACGPCNGPKNSNFAIIPPGSNDLLDVSRGRGAPVIPPPPGGPALINPRTEDPFDYLELDLAGTFFVVARQNLSTRDENRATYTIEILRLNTRDYLVEAREDAFESYLSRLKAYVDDKRSGASTTVLDRSAKAIQRMPHIMVWKEMQRSAASYPRLQALFAAAPEASTW